MGTGASYGGYIYIYFKQIYLSCLYRESKLSNFVAKYMQACMHGELVMVAIYIYIYIYLSCLYRDKAIMPA